jgi:hypothetical protein
MVISLTVAKFKALIIIVYGFSLSYVADICFFVILYTDSQNSDTTAPSCRELYHWQFSLQAASPGTFGYTFVHTIISKQGEMDILDLEDIIYIQIVQDVEAAVIAQSTE